MSYSVCGKTESQRSKLSKVSQGMRGKPKIKLTVKKMSTKQNISVTMGDSHSTKAAELNMLCHDATVIYESVYAQECFVYHQIPTVSFFFFFFFFFFLRATPAAYESSQSRGPIRAIAASLCHSHSNARSKTHLQPIPQLLATPDP